MKVLQVMNYSAPYRGNFIDSVEMIENNDLEKIENFYLFHKETKVKSASWIDSINRDSKHAFYLDYSKESLLKDIKRINEIVKNNHIDIVHMHFWGIRMHTMISLALMGTKTVLIRHFHNHSDYNEHPLRRIYGNIVYRNATMIGCSESVTESIRRDFPHIDARCVNNAISFERLDQYEAIEKRKDLSVMMFGADFERKGVDIAYKAINDLRKKGNKIVLWIVCSINEAVCKEKLKKMTETNEIPNWVRFLPPRQDIATYYKAANIFISPSREEGFTYAIPEAAYCGCKVIATRIGGQSYHERVLGGGLLYSARGSDSLRKCYN